MGQGQQRIVIVDDDPVGSRILRYILAEEGYDAITVTRGSQVFEHVIGQDTSLVLLDINLPDVDGFALCRELRARRYNGPLMFLTSRSSITDRLEGFRLGADDYVTKPYDHLELVARIQAIIRRSNRADAQALGTVVHVEDAVLSLGELTYASKVVPPTILTPTEMRILECLMRNSRIVISRETLIERVWGFDFYGDTNRVDVYIRRVRRKIEVDPTMPEYLHTVRGIGYVFRVEPRCLVQDSNGIVNDEPAASWMTHSDEISGYAAGVLLSEAAGLALAASQ
ncbi:MAG TPA: response regulator transcription factor [Thermomicrobiales bacterium]|nr:response regulator transcription factor [Thermomicrobiales bacterium]